MSLFRAREWWSTKLGEGEEFDKGSMALGNVDNDSMGGVKVVTGSFQGVLRVHHPVQADFRIEDLLLEQDLGTPIIQVSVGRFIPSAPQINAIAVLHPRKLGVYTVEAVGGTGAKASYFDLVKAYEHVLGIEGGGHFTSCNMTHGGFGGVSRDLLCVQSMDGRLQIFEQDAHAFTRRLNGILVPGPLCYVAKIDAFVVGNSEMGVDCYKYQALAASQEDREKGRSEGISAARGLQAYWSCQLGEAVLDVFVAKFSRALGPGCVDVVVVGERTLFTLREQGTVRLQKVLGYQPACACKYVVVAGPGEAGAGLTGTTVRGIDEGFATVVEEENLVIAADTDQLMVYKDLQLVWQATVRRAPVVLTVAKFGPVPGIVCSLDDTGVLSACYQGTDPPTSAVVAAERKDIDYDQINQEHRKLLQIIRRSQTDSARPPAGKLTLHAQVPRFLDDARRQGKQQQQSRRDGNGRAAGGLYDEDARRGSYDGSLRSLPPLSVAAAEGHQEKRHQAGVVSVTVSFVVTYSGPGEVRDATLNIVPPPGFFAEPSSVLLPPVCGSNGGGSRDAGRGGGGGGGGSGNDPIVVAIVLSAERGTQRLPSTLAGEASVVYTRQGTGGDGRCEPMSARCALLLPLALAGKVVEPVPRKGDGNAHKFTFSTTRPAVPLSTLFEDMATSSSPRGDVGDGASPSPPTNRGANSLEDSKSNGAGGGTPAASFGDSGGEALVPCSIGKESTAFSLRYWAVGAGAEGGGQDVSVTVSKNSGRYRIQSESLPAVCVMATEVVRRLREYFGDPAGGRNRGSEEHPAADEGKTSPRTGEKILGCLSHLRFYAVIDEHYDRRRDLQDASESLNRAAHQYRVVEKRLLSRFKDRNPAPLDSLDVVSEETYQRLVELCDGVERAQDRLAVSAARLGCAVRLVALLAQHRFQLPCKDHKLLLAHLYPDVTNTEDQGWEESVHAAVTHLLRTSLAKVAKDAAPPSAGQTPPLSMPADTVKLKKHLSIVFDRLNKGARLVVLPSSSRPSSPRSSSAPDSQTPVLLASSPRRGASPPSRGAPERGYK
ncbi:unnamed protein product [Ectocarpus sp. 8 AP-2014]